MTSGSFSTNAYQNRNLVFSWSVQSQSVDKSETVIAWKVSGGGSATGYYYTQNFVLKIDGVTVWSLPYSSGQVKLYNGTVVKEGTTTIKHNKQGKASFTAYLEAGIYVWSPANCKGSETFELPDIARASTIDSAENITLGNPCAVKWTPKAGGFYFKLNFKLGNWSHTTSLIKLTSASAYTYKGYSPPVDGVAQQITKSKKGTMTVTLYTYSDSGGNNQIGGSDSETFQVTVPDNDATKPTVSMSLKPVSNLPSEFAGLYIQGRTKVDADFTGSAKFGASMGAYSMTVGGKTYGSPYASAYLTTDGSVEVKGTGTDSREISRVVTETINVLKYAKPQAKLTRCERCSADGTPNDSGESLLLTVGKVYSDLNGKNRCKAYLRWRLATAPETGYSSWIELPGQTADGFSGVYSNVVFMATVSYVVQVKVQDTVGEYATISATIPTAEVHSHETHNGLALGMYRDSGGFEVAWDTHLYGNVSGRVMGLGALPQIPPNSDVNNYRSFGAWSIPTNAVAETINNLPNPYAGVLVVKSGTGTDDMEGNYVYIIQEYTNYRGNVRKYRCIATTGVAGEWSYDEWTNM